VTLRFQCAVYKSIYLLTYLLYLNPVDFSVCSTLQQKSYR